MNKIKESKLFNEKVRGQISEVVEYLNRVFPTQAKFLNPTNIIPIYVIAKEYMDTIDERKFYSLIMNVFEDSDRLKEIKEQWSSNKGVAKRIKVLNELYNDEINM